MPRLRFRQTHAIVLTVMMGLATASPIAAAIIYQTDDPGGAFGYWGFDISSAQSVGIRVTPASTYTLDSIGLWLMNNDFGGTVHPLVRVTLRNDDTNAAHESRPGSQILEERFVTVTAVGWNPVLEIATSVTHPRLCAGRNYWIVAESSAPGGQDGVWVMAAEGAGFSANTDQGGGWQAGGSGAAPGARVLGTLVVPGDIDANGAANAADVARFIAALLGTPQSPADSIRADLNCDDRADGRDIALFVRALTGN